MRLNNGINVQLIKAYTGRPVDVMMTFDMVNCMTAVTENAIIQETRFKELEEQRKIKVVSWSSPFVIHRLIKYLYKDRERTLDDETRRQLIPAIVELARRANTGEFDDPAYGNIGKDFVYRKLRHLVGDFMKKFTNEELLMVSLLKGFDDRAMHDNDAAYNYALRELLRRNRPKENISGNANDDHVFTPVIM
jgi:hypothetical protein